MLTSLLLKEKAGLFEISHGQIAYYLCAESLGAVTSVTFQLSFSQISCKENPKPLAQFPRTNLTKHFINPSLTTSTLRNLLFYLRS